MKPASFDYHRPQQVDEVLALLQRFGENSKILAGGQSLMPLMNFRLAQPVHLIDINFIKGLDYIKRANGRIQLGCLVRQSHLETDPLITQYCPLLAEASTFVGYSQTRNRGTLCGSVAHADPAAELPAALLALDGIVTVGNSTSRREIRAGDLFLSYYTTALSPVEMILDVSIPEMPGGAGWSFMEFARRFGDFAIVAVAVVLVLDRERISDVRISVSGVDEKPWRDREVEQARIGEMASEKLFKEFGTTISTRINPVSDIHATESYRRLLSGVLTTRALTEAWNRAKRRG